MKPYLVNTPRFIQYFFSNQVWNFPNKKNTIFLTFDDGPIPKITPWVIKVLKKHQAKATFFCIGENIQKNPEILKALIVEGHSIGNHTFNHLKGWKTNTKKFIKNTEKAQQLINSEISKIMHFHTPITYLFRPPYGKITPYQSKILRQKGYKIIMWDVLSADFDYKTTKEKCLQNVLNNIKEGSIVVFHDSLKAEEKLKYVLPKVLQYIDTKNWKSAAI